MLSFAKYKTVDFSSNVAYMSRLYKQNFHAYSSINDILIMIEPKYQLHVYNAQTVHLVANLTTPDIIYVASCTSLSTHDKRGLFFIYESRSLPNILSLRVCEMNFNKIKSSFHDKICIETLKLHSGTKDIHVNGFTMKLNHAGTQKSILFITTNIGLIYAIFNTYSGTLVHEPVLLNETLNEGNVVITSSSVVYYADIQEQTIFELRITPDFRMRYGKIIKSNAIRIPFGLLADECNHL